MRPSTPTSPARSSSTCARIDQVNISPTLRQMPSSRTSMTFFSRHLRLQQRPTPLRPVRVHRVSRCPEDNTMIIAIVRQALSPAVLNPVLRDALSRHLRRRPCRNQPVVFVDDDEKIPVPNVLRTRKTFSSNSWLHWLRSCRLLRPSLMCSAVKCRQSAERLPRRGSMSATHQRSGSVHAAARIMSTPTVHS